MTPRLDRPLSLALMTFLFLTTFIVFLLFNDDLIAKVVMCAFSGGFAVLTGIRLFRVVRLQRGSQPESDA